MGIVIVAIPFFLRMREVQQTNMYIEKFEEAKEDEENEKENSSEEKKDAIILQEKVIGIIEISSLDIRYPIFEGTGASQLNAGIGHMSNTTELCGQGNCVLAGHNGSRYGAYFTKLSRIRLGAKVTVTNQQGETHNYKVKEIKTVNPYDEWVTQETDTEELTIFTCADKGTKRFVCKCMPVLDDGYKAD